MAGSERDDEEDILGLAGLPGTHYKNVYVSSLAAVLLLLLSRCFLGENLAAAGV